MPPSLRKLIDSWYPGYRGTLGTGAFTLIDPVSWHGVRPATSGTGKLNKAFTLIELLIVISILAILGSAISIVLNPAELLAEARDSQRINDLESLRNSLSLTLIDNPSLFDPLSNTSIYLSLPVSSCLTNPPSGYTYICNSTSPNLQKTDSTGWLPLSLTNLPIFPIDPINSSSSSLYYAFVPDLTNKTFVLTSLLESEKYLKLSALKDGGTDPSRIEEGNPSLWTSASGLVGYWPMDEGSGSVAGDLSNSGKNATLFNGLVWASASSCKVGACLNFDGNDDYLTFNPINAGTTYTLVAWVNPGEATASDWFNILSNKGQPQWGAPDSSLVAQLYGRVTGSALVRNSWSNVITTRSGNDYKIYIDGSLSSQSNIVAGADYYWVIGAYVFDHIDIATREPWNGLLDEIRIYNRPLSEAEIQAIYSAQK